MAKRSVGNATITSDLKGLRLMVGDGNNLVDMQAADTNDGLVVVGGEGATAVFRSAGGAIYQLRDSDSGTEQNVVYIGTQDNGRVDLWTDFNINNDKINTYGAVATWEDSPAGLLVRSMVNGKEHCLVLQGIKAADFANLDGNFAVNTYTLDEDGNIVVTPGEAISWASSRGTEGREHPVFQKFELDFHKATTVKMLDSDGMEINRLYDLALEEVRQAVVTVQAAKTVAGETQQAFDVANSTPAVTLEDVQASNPDVNDPNELYELYLTAQQNQTDNLETLRSANREAQNNYQTALFALQEAVEGASTDYVDIDMDDAKELVDGTRFISEWES